MALALARSGADLAVCDRDADNLETLAARLESPGRRCVTGVLDVREPDQVATFLEQVADALRQVDILVNNAGRQVPRRLRRRHVKGQSSLVRENFDSVTHFIRGVLPLMPAEGGSIVNITSIEAHRAAPGFAVYSAQKAAVASLSKSLALELGRTAHPGQLRRPRRDPDARRRRAARPPTTPLPMRGDVDDVAAAVVFLAGDLAASSPARPCTSTAATWPPAAGTAPATGRSYPMKFGVALGRLNPAFFVEATDEAERLGFESVWLPEHLVFPVEMTGRRTREPSTRRCRRAPPVFDVFAYLAFLAGAHPSASGWRPTSTTSACATRSWRRGRCRRSTSCRGAGPRSGSARAGWRASGRPPGSTSPRAGAALDEALDVCKRLWTEAPSSTTATFFDFAAVMFEPKPVQKPWPPIHVGGESPAALRRAARVGDGWVGMEHTLDSVGDPWRACASCSPSTAGRRPGSR